MAHRRAKAMATQSIFRQIAGNSGTACGRFAFLRNRQVMIRRWSTRSEPIVALLFALIPLAFIAGVALFQLERNVPDARLARANTVLAFKTIRLTGEVDHAMQDTERGQRGYLITGQDDYLAPYNHGVERLPALMFELQQALASSPEQQHWMLKLQADVTTKLNELARTIATLRKDGYDAARNIVLTDVGRHSMEAVRADLVAITDRANQELEDRLAVAVAAEEAVTLTFVVGSIIAAIALMIGGLLLARAGQRAANSEQALQATLDSVREGVGAFDRSGRLRAWNGLFARMVGIADDRLRAGEKLPSEDGAGGGLAARLRTLEGAARGSGRPALAEHHGDRDAVIEIYHNPMSDGGAVVTLLDVTDQRKAEEAFRQAQRLDSMGRHHRGGGA